MNYFNPKSAAERYAGGRPYFHPQVIRRIKERLPLPEPVSCALDVACGTGLSSVALRGIARDVLGTDISAEMIALAPREDQVRYMVASAEELPCKDSSFGILTVSSALHWIDRTRFLSEAQRVLMPLGWLVVYDNSFKAQMEENPNFREWCLEVYLRRYPSPPRQRTTFGSEDTMRDGFHFLGQEQYQNTVRFSVDELAGYMLTQTNVIAAVEGGRESIEGIRAWLMKEIEPLFVDKPSGTKVERATFHFGGPIWYMMKSSSQEV